MGQNKKIKLCWLSLEHCETVLKKQMKGMKMIDVHTDLSTFEIKISPETLSNYKGKVIDKRCCPSIACENYERSTEINVFQFSVNYAPKCIVY